MMKDNEILEDAETPSPETSATDKIDDPPLQTSSTKPGQLPGKKKTIGKGGYQETVAKIERENKVLLKKFDKIETFLDRLSASPAGGDLTSFVERGLSVQGPPQAVIPGRDEIARTWESGKHTFEELIADYERLRSQKIWSQEDLEGILIRFETLAGEISRSVLTCQNAIEGILPALSGHSEERAAALMSTEEISRLSQAISKLGERITESREAILGAIGDKNVIPPTTGLPERNQELLSHALQKIGNIEDLLKGNRPAPSFEADLSDESATTGSSQGVRNHLFSKRDPVDQKPVEKTVVPPRIKRLGFVGLMAVFAIVAVVARVKHSGPPPEMANPVATRNTLPPPINPSPIEKRSYEEPPKFQSIEPVLSGLDKLREGVNENGQAIADLSGKIDRALTSLPKGTSLSIPEKRLIDEGRELEWLVRTWPAGPGRKELLRMMGNYAGE